MVKDHKVAATKARIHGTKAAKLNQKTIMHNIVHDLLPPPQ